MQHQSKIFNYASAAFVLIALFIAISGKTFINGYNISPASTSMIEASLMQVSHTRYLIASILCLVATVLIAVGQILDALKLQKL